MLMRKLGARYWLRAVAFSAVGVLIMLKLTPTRHWWVGFVLYAAMFMAAFWIGPVVHARRSVDC